MILSNLKLVSRANQRWEFSGLDQLDQCINRRHFLSYPHNITYRYNSRGFRDQEWPESTKELQDAIWCLGDSFTVGIGSPIEHTWPHQLSKITNQRIINVSLDGASNEWIARTTEKIVQAVNPLQLVIMWSFTHRREHTDISLSDEKRRIHKSKCSDSDDWVNFLDCKKRVNSIADSVQLSVPYFHSAPRSVSIDWNLIRGTDWPVDPPATLQELNSLPTWILSEIDNLHNCLDKMQYTLKYQQTPTTDIIPVKCQDLARDGYHFDLITAEWVAAQVANRLY